MLENGDHLEVSADVDVGKMEFSHHRVSTLALDSFYGLRVKKPYAINLNKVECIVGEWNKDKTEYGLRIFFASGNSVWIGKSASESLLNALEKTVGKDLWRERDLRDTSFYFHMAAK